MPPTKQYQIEDFTGKTFGTLTCTGEVHRGLYDRAFLFTCSCGQIIRFPTRRLSTLHEKSTCWRCNWGANPPPRASGSRSGKWTGGVYVPGAAYYVAKQSAEERQILWAVTLDDLDYIWEEQGGKCAYTGWPLAFRNGTTRATASLDRIDSRGSYNPYNIQWVHKVVNLAKRNTPDEDFIRMCAAVAEKHRDQ